MIVFKTPGLVDLTALTTFGVNVKKSTNPIGQFGTGFKYAVATILRLGGAVTVFRGQRRFEFTKTQKKIRGTKFDIVTLVEYGGPDEIPESTDLGFTTQLGNKWTPWMAYRELLCNTVDECGVVEQVADPTFQNNYTKIVVSGANFDQEHEQRHRNFLFEKTEAPRWSNDFSLEIWAGSAPCVYFKRVRAYDEPNGLPFLLTHNLIAEVTLTEDRTLKYDPLDSLGSYLVACDDEALLSQILLCDRSWAEHHINWTWSGTPSDAFVNVVRTNIRNPALVDSARRLVQRARLSLFVDEVELNAVDRSKLNRAIWFCNQIGYTVNQPIAVAASLAGDGVLGFADVKQNKIVLSLEVFKKGTKEVAQTLLEEHIHLQFGLTDESRAMQEHLFQLTVSLGERVLGEAL